MGIFTLCFLVMLIYCGPFIGQGQRYAGKMSFLVSTSNHGDLLSPDTLDMSAACTRNNIGEIIVQRMEWFYARQRSLLYVLLRSLGLDSGKILLTNEVVALVFI